MEETEHSNKNQNVESIFVKILTTTFKEVGLAGFICIFLVVVFFSYASIEQKSEFIDKFLLFKNIQNEPFPFTFVTIILFIIIIGSNYYNHNERKKLKEEIDRISKEKADLQSKILNKLLETSK